MVRTRLGDEELFQHVAGTIESGTEEGKEIASKLVSWAVAAVLSRLVARDVVRGNEHAHTAAADKDAEDLDPSVANLEEDEGNDDDTDNGPEVDELGREKVGIGVGANSEVVALDIQERHDQVSPPVLAEDTAEFGKPIAHDEYGKVDDEDENVVEDCLEGGDIVASLREKLGKCGGRGDAEREDLAENDKDPKVRAEGKVPPVRGLGLEDMNTPRYLFVSGVGGVVAAQAGHVGGRLSVNKLMLLLVISRRGWRSVESHGDLRCFVRVVVIVCFVRDASVTCVVGWSQQVGDDGCDGRCRSHAASLGPCQQHSGRISACWQRSTWRKRRGLQYEA